MFKRNKIILIFTCLIFAVIIVSCKSDEEKPHVHTEGAWQIVYESTCTKEGLKQTGGYCPCRRERTKENICICEEFKKQIKDPDFEGFCHCMLY